MRRRDATADYTKRSAMRLALQQMRLIARDRNRVFAVSANRPVLSARDAENAYQIDKGCGNAFVEFDADDAEVTWGRNKLTQEVEATLRGDVDLTHRNPLGSDDN